MPARNFKNRDRAASRLLRSVALGVHPARLFASRVTEGSSMSGSTRIARTVVFAACWLSTFGGCGSQAPTPPMAAGSGGAPVLVVENPGSAGRVAAVGGSEAAGVSAPSPGGAGATAAGSGGVSASAGAAAAGRAAIAGSGGNVSAGAGGSGVAGGASAADDDDDLLGGLLPTPQVSCDGLVCLEDADCADLYPDEDALCHFTHCQDLTCQ
jgi:hypothetical protein